MMPSFWRPEQGEPWHDDVTMEDLGVVRDYLMTVESDEGEQKQRLPRTFVADTAELDSDRSSLGSP